MPDEMGEEEKHHAHLSLKWIALEYNVGSRVVEFYRPKEEFRNKNYRINVNGRRVTLIEEDGRIRSLDIKAVIEDTPYRIDFDRNRWKRWEIKDKDGDEKCYECKRERARTDDVIPED